MGAFDDLLIIDNFAGGGGASMSDTLSPLATELLGTRRVPAATPECVRAALAETARFDSNKLAPVATT